MISAAPIFTRILGCDVSKDSVAIYDTHTGQLFSVANTTEDLARFLVDLGSETLAVCEATGGYERVLLEALLGAGVPAHRADTVRVKAFIRSRGVRAKTDAIDARGLARYGQERGGELALWVAPDGERLRLQALVVRRSELVAVRTAEINRSKAPGAALLAASHHRLLAFLESELQELRREIDQLVAASERLQKTLQCLMSIPGIGALTAVALVALMPELGTLHGKQAACLAGVAPHARDSGTYRGYRTTGGGRRTIATLLFMPALAAARAKGPLRSWYQSLIARGKPKRLVLTALMRKIIVIANARIRDMNLQN
ncbi:IS110 family transposase [Mongoliimonas terrestris]|uniref:IS110 family transposase n=1 Tax=Mongoliimonas terrestris TaxID=1709001 RepID=UPI0009496D39|nr:IS110 family transposase [Mongoliimonas terrestris]